MVVTIENKIKSYPNSEIKKKKPVSGNIRETYFVPIGYISETGWSSEVARDNYGDGNYQKVTKGNVEVKYVKWFTNCHDKGIEDVYFEWEGKKLKIQDGGRNFYKEVLNDKGVIKAFIEYLPEHVSKQFPEIRNYQKEIENSNIKLKDNTFFKAIKEDRNGKDWIRMVALSKHLKKSEKDLVSLFEENPSNIFNLDEIFDIRDRGDNSLWGFHRDSIPEVVEGFEKYYKNIEVEA